jgi:beta-galactosidase
VKQGGVLLADCRTGVKDEHNLCHPRTLPGKLSPVLGIVIEEYEALTGDLKYRVTGKKNLPGEFTAEHYVDWVTAKKARTLAEHTQWHLKSFAAVTRNSFGKGRGWYVGVIAREEEFYDLLIAGLLTDAGIQAIVHPPLGVEVSVREGKKGKKLLFLINHTEEPQTVRVPSGKTEVIKGRKTKESIELGPLDVALIRLQAR